MDKNPVAWGLDIGHSSIKAVQLSRVGDHVVVQAYAIEPIATGEEIDREEAVVKAFQSLATREQFGTTPVVAALSGRQIFSRTINIPVINPKKVAKMVELEARQQIPGDFNEVEWSYHMSPSADGASNDVAIFAARKELIGELVAKCRRVGINLVNVSVSSLALYNFVRYDQEFGPEETIAILDVGAENTDLVLYQGDTLWMRTLASSGNDITKAFMKKFRVSFEEAEQLKRQLAESRQADKVFKVIEGSLNELMAEVQRSLGFYKQTNSGANLENMVISGNTFKLPNLPQYVADRLRMAIISLEDLERIQVAPGLDRSHFLQDLQSLGVAMGLALQGTGAAAANVNLMPTQARLQQLLKTKRWAAAVVLAAILVTILIRNFVYGAVIAENIELIQKIKDAHRQNEKAEKEAKAVLDQIKPLAPKLASFEDYGRHKGVLLAVNQGVLGVLSQAVSEYGKVTVAAPIEVEGGDAVMQRLYLGKIEIPTFDYRVDPFQPAVAARRVVVEVLIVREDKDDTLGISLDLTNRLKDVPVPDQLKGMIPGERLFTDVQNRGSRPVEMSYWYKDEKFVDERGNLRPLEKEVRFKVSSATFDCTLAVGGEAKP